jgi:hypothetical protein
MKARDVKKCCRCGHGVAKHGMVFYTIRLQQWALDPRAIQKTHGLEQFFGGGTTGATMAGIMGTDPDIAVPLNTSSTDQWVCLDCATKPCSLVYYIEDSVDAEVSSPQ